MRLERERDSVSVDTNYSSGDGDQLWRWRWKLPATEISSFLLPFFSFSILCTFSSCYLVHRLATKSSVDLRRLGNDQIFKLSDLDTEPKLSSGLGQQALIWTTSRRLVVD